MTTPKLKPCPDPKCDGAPEMVEDRHGFYRIICSKCCWQSPMARTPSTAAEAWNRRDDSPSTTDNRTEWGTCKICGLSRALKDGLCKHCVYEQEAPNE